MIGISNFCCGPIAFSGFVRLCTISAMKTITTIHNTINDSNGNADNDSNTNDTVLDNSHGNVDNESNNNNDNSNNDDIKFWDLYSREGRSSVYIYIYYLDSCLGGLGHPLLASSLVRRNIYGL